MRKHDPKYDVAKPYYILGRDMFRYFKKFLSDYNLDPENKVDLSKIDSSDSDTQRWLIVMTELVEQINGLVDECITYFHQQIGILEGKL